MNQMDYRWTTDLQSQEYLDLKLLRLSVFVDELGGNPEVEIADEEHCEFLALYLGKQCIGSGRLYPVTPQKVRLQRIVIHPQYRNQGIGHQLMLALEERCVQKGFKTIEICASSRAIRFYQKLQYCEEGIPFDRCGIPHIVVTKNMNVV